MRGSQTSPRYADIIQVAKMANGHQKNRSPAFEVEMGMAPKTA
jgi:hypothetical protein